MLGYFVSLPHGIHIYNFTFKQVLLFAGNAHNEHADKIQNSGEYETQIFNLLCILFLI